MLLLLQLPSKRASSIPGECRGREESGFFFWSALAVGIVAGAAIVRFDIGRNEGGLCVDGAVG